MSRSPRLYAAACASLLVLAAVPAAASVDLYVDESGALAGDGSLANPYRRITDAVERVRSDRGSGAILPGEAIQIHVAPGTYVGSYDPTALALHPEYEVLPIILNVSGLAVLGSTSLVRDERGLPTGSEPLSDTILEPDGPMGPTQSLFLVANTSDGSVGNAVTVDGFVLDGIGGSYPHIPVVVDRVSGFRISNNVIRHGSFGIHTRLASGAIEGNLLKDNSEAGGSISGGSLAQPSTVLIHANRVTDHGLHGIIALAIASDTAFAPGANTLGLESLQLTFDRNDPEDLQHIPDTLSITLSDNDLSANGVFGLRFMAVIPHGPLTDCSSGIGYETLDATQPLTAVLTAEVTGNTFTGNGYFGIGMEAGFPCRNDPRSIVATFAGTFEGNSFAENPRGAAFFGFTRWDTALIGGNLQSWKFEEQSTYEVTDVDGELTGFAYYHPLTDPVSGATLDNTLRMNGVAVPHGARGGLPACKNGIDDDGDGLVDRADPGCPSSLWPFATTESPQCDDGLDNDGNNLVDFADPKCSRSWPYWEKTPVCGLGAEVALLLGPLLLIRRRFKRAGQRSVRDEQHQPASGST